MLIFSVSRVFALRGIDKPYAFLTKIGLTRGVAFNLTNYLVGNIKIGHIEKICRALNCTPNDLFEWRTDETDTLGADHALNSLKRTDSAKKIGKMIKEIPLDKLGQVEEFLNQLKNEDKTPSSPPEN